ncbi:aminoglycoside phosphotransferase (APT) family kinase protein [Nocardia transvalensis]|uniref:Aminoglycoside phosphotransferase (APT) family kinase protein n=1 Tax=Nocardia transvalensis TaxID=37333 RepID=A0A7W9UJZ0_9NOCA|nr:aminoglycoside phosphotransferase family protein [Nocardia transvalensis]MBB5915901.1 aminoglycoside phosphotransferase (APT) family kinase protein [Nocardia transvalensis]
MGLRTDDARLLRVHSNAVYVVDDRVVIRISRSPQHGIRAGAAVAVAHWLAGQGLPVTEPMIDRPVHSHGATVTFWRYYPQYTRTRPPARELGRILRHLHAVGEPPPFGLPRYVPLAGLTQTLAAAPRVLAPGDRHWLAEQAGVLIEEYGRLDSALGTGLVHGDAYPGNTLWNGDSVLLGDWDEASVAPRELDLVNTYQGIRFGHTENELREFALAYGWDVRAWVGFPILRAMRDLHTLTSYIRRAEYGDAAAANELRHRLRSLRDPEQTDTRWHAVA